MWHDASITSFSAYINANSCLVPKDPEQVYKELNIQTGTAMMPRRQDLMMRLKHYLGGLQSGRHDSPSSPKEGLVAHGFPLHTSRLFFLSLANAHQASGSDRIQEVDLTLFTDIQRTPHGANSALPHSGSLGAPSTQDGCREAEQQGERGGGRDSVYHALFGLIMGKDLNKSHREQKVAAAIS